LWFWALADAMDELLVASQGLSRASLSTLLATHLDSAVAGRVATTLRKVFIEAFLHAFFQQNLRWLLWRASRDLVGEFALMTASTLTSHIGVFARTQSFSLGYNRTLGEVFGSAEPIGVTMAL
jgi:hypothetical protein